MSQIAVEDITIVILTSFYTRPYRLSPGEGGLVTFLLNLLSGLGSNYKRTFVVANGEGKYQEYIERHSGANIVVARMKKPIIRKRLPYATLLLIMVFYTLIRVIILFIRHYRDFLASKKVVLHANEPESLIAAIILSKLLKIADKKSRVIFTEHLVYNLKSNSFIRHLAEKVFNYFTDKIVCLSHFMADELAKIGVRSSKIVVIPHWINYSKFRMLDRKEARLSLGLDPNVFTILFIGRLVQERGMDIAIKAVESVKEKVGSVKMVVVGTGPFEALMRRTLSQELFEIRGFVKEEEERGLYYSAADVVVFPTRSIEAFGLVILEGLACGTPVLAPESGSIPEILSGFPEFTFKRLAPEELCYKILEIYDLTKNMSREEQMRFRLSLREYVMKKFPNRVNLYVKLYETV